MLGSKKATSDVDNRNAANSSKLSGLAGKLGTMSINTLELAASEQALQVLDLKDHKISAVPAELFQMFAQVKVLDLRKNAIEELLPDISHMRSLEDLLLDQNRLREFPSEACSLPLLKTLSLSQNILRHLPAAIGEMRSLHSLSLGDNQLENIPAELGSCSDLHVLYLHHNHFLQLPTSIHKLENLSELALEWFRYTTPPLPRVIKGAEWKRIITKFLGVCKEKADKNEVDVSCIEILREFSQKTFDPNAIDSKRRTRLHVACLEGHVGVAMALASNGSKCDSLDCEGYSPLLVAVREEHPDIATALVKSGVDVNRGGGLFGSPLHVATVNFDPQMVQLLIRGEADVNQTDADGNTPLHVLMSVFDKGGRKAGHIGQTLLKNNADCNLMNTDKWAPLHLAARRGQLRGICFVVSHVDDVDPACLNGTCTCAVAAKKPKNTRVRTCTRAFDVNLRGGSHLWTPMHLAGHACHVPVVQVLIEAGADVFLRNIDGRTARHVSRGNLAISKLLLKAEGEWLWYRIHGGEKGLEGGLKQPRKKVSNLSKDGDDEEDIIEEIAKDIEGKDGGCESQTASGGYGSTSTTGAEANRPMYRIVERCRDVYFGKAELQQIQAANYVTPCQDMEEFVATFTKLTQQGPKNRLPLFMSKPWVKAMLPKLLEDVEYHHLLLHPPLVCNEDFIRLFICNIARGQLSIFGKLRSTEQESLLHVLCRSASGGSIKAFPGLATRADILSLLLTACPPNTFDLEAQDDRGQTPLHLAAQSGDIGLVQVLLECGANPNAQEETTGWTPLHFAVSKAHYSLILQLLHHEATNVNQVDKFEWPPLLEACSRLDARAASLLVNGGADLSFRTQYYDVLKAVDTSKKDLAAKRWMSSLLVSNGFRFEQSMVQLNTEDRERLDRERQMYLSRSSSAVSLFGEANGEVQTPPFWVPDHLAPRCHACKVLFSVTVRRYFCRSCGLVLCGDCFKWRRTCIVALDEMLHSRGSRSQAITAGGSENSRTGPGVQQLVPQPPCPSPVLSGNAAKVTGLTPGGLHAGGSSDFEDMPLAEEVPALGPPVSAICPASMSTIGTGNIAKSSLSQAGQPMSRVVRHDSSFNAGCYGGGLLRERGPSNGGAAKTVRLCGSCCTFHEAGVGETYAMLQKKVAGGNATQHI
jgi:ankyrin repeat protein